jgi:hypothetical protein
LPTHRLPADTRRGQAMIEFSLIVPVIFLVVFGIFEFGLLTFDLASTRFATSEAAKVVAQAGNGNLQCSNVKGCPALFGASLPSPPNDLCDADCQMISTVNQTALATTALEQVNHIDLYKLKSDGSFGRVPGAQQSYKLDGTRTNNGYPPSSRNTQVGVNDYVEVDITFTYNPLTGLFKNIVGSPQLTTTYIVRLEPQRY